LAGAVTTEAVGRVENYGGGELSGIELLLPVSVSVGKFLVTGGGERGRTADSLCSRTRFGGRLHVLS
jgi:hypothetical protein